MSTKETILEIAEQMVEMVMVAFAEGRTSLEVITDSEGEPHVVLYLEHVPAVVLVMDPSKYPAPSGARMQ